LGGGGVSIPPVKVPEVDEGPFGPLGGVCELVAELAGAGDCIADEFLHHPQESALRGVGEQCNDGGNAAEKQQKVHRYLHNIYIIA